MKYKYRYRLDLKEISATPKHKLIINLMSDIYSITDLLRAETSDTHTQSITTLVCDSQRVRDEWLRKLEELTARAKSSIVESKTSSRHRASNRNVSKVNLFLRIRPFVMSEEKKLGQICVSVDEGKQRLTLRQDSLDANRGDRVASYDHIFGVEDKQIDIFNTVGREVLGGIFAGYSVAILAYGNTGAGKTYTMFGESAPEKKGLVPRLLA